MVLPPLAPCTIDKVLGEADREKLGTGAAVTLRLTVVVLVKLPEVPVMVTVAVPVAAVLLAVSVKVLELGVLVELAGLNEAVTPAGKPEAGAAMLTLPLKPFTEATETVLEPLVPCMMLKALGDAERVKLGDVLVVSVTLSNVAAARLVLSSLLKAKPM
jgi:hypothetical protein